MTAAAVDRAALREIAVTVAREAGALLAARRGEHLVADAKSTPTDAVTEVDRASEALIVRRIGEMRPGDGILGEEGADTAGSTGVRWVVDPLDGTVNYLYGIGAYAVSIAAEVDGVTVAGAVFDAATGRMYDAALGDGATLDGAALACSKVDSLDMSLVGTGFGYSTQVRADQAAVVAALLPRVRDIRRFGSAALDLCAVASGSLDGYYERGIHPWDRAAGLLIASEAGARWVVIAEGSRDLTLAAAPAIFDPLLAAVT